MLSDQRIWLRYFTGASAAAREAAQARVHEWSTTAVSCSGKHETELSTLTDDPLIASSFC